MTAPRRPRTRSSTAFRTDTVAFIHDDRESPDYPTGMLHFWHKFSLQKGHVGAGRGYSVRDACTAYGIDPDELLSRLGPSASGLAAREAELRLALREQRERDAAAARRGI
jgi:hypothetical protein